jgi:hypothetical protein
MRKRRISINYWIRFFGFRVEWQEMVPGNKWTDRRSTRRFLCYDEAEPLSLHRFDL